jgi:hypothetical protein
MDYQSVSTHHEKLPRPSLDVPWRPPAEVSELLDERRSERDRCAAALESLTGREDVGEVVALLTRRDALDRLIRALETPPKVSASASLRVAWGPDREAPPEPTERERLEERRRILVAQLSGDRDIPLTDSQRGALHGFPDYGGNMRRGFDEENRARVETELREVESALAALGGGGDRD